MERNWLIRTAQNQILGPVSKIKLVEFIQKGALGLTDEVSSGNGYWVGIKEKDLLDKYVFGDIPQSYNPISEARTVLANQENPDNTSSLNLSPANIKAQPIIDKDEKVVLPKNDDLEFPDMDNISGAINAEREDVTRLANLSELKKKSDLEFPDFSEHSVDSDITRISQGPKISAPSSDDLKFEVPKEYQSAKSTTTDLEAVLPKKEDLEFPDLGEILKEKLEEKKEELKELKEVVGVNSAMAASKDNNTSTKIDPDSILNLEIDFTRTVALKDAQSREILEVNSPKPKPVAKKTQNEQPKKVSLHERKTKTTFKKNVEELRDPKREQVYTKTSQPPLKKRNDTYLFFILFLIIIIIVGVFYYFKEILNKPFLA